MSTRRTLLGLSFVFPIVFAIATLSCSSGGTTASSGDTFSDTGIANVDLAGVNWSCTTPAWTQPTCAPGTVTHPPLQKADHIDLPTPISYTDVPPSSGPHRPVWGKWGTYTFLPPQRWVHNLEHGAVALLYHPCLPASEVAKLKAWAETVQADAGGAFRWVLTPYPGLQSAMALVAWGHVYQASCWNPSEANNFVKNFYRQAPEDEAGSGGYSEMWLGL